MARTIRLKNNELAAYKWNHSLNIESAAQCCAKLLKISYEKALHVLHSEKIHFGTCLNIIVRMLKGGCVVIIVMNLRKVSMLTKCNF